MLISPFTPLFFDTPKTDGIDSDYEQVFATTDRLLVEVIAAADEHISGYVVADGGSTRRISFRRWAMNPQTTLWFFDIRFEPGRYALMLRGDDGVKYSNWFTVTDCPETIMETTLIQYSNLNNRQRKDAVFSIDGMPYFFDFRVHGGFRDSDWAFAADTEQFVTPSSDIAQLYGLESTQKTFTMGSAEGVPVWFGEHLNRLLCCSHVYFDGIKYTRKENSVPELNVQQEGVNSFVFRQLLQRSVNLDPVLEQSNHVVLRRITSSSYRDITDNINRKI